ncbi:MAG: DUF3011 domain-containing protein [Gomphosphaeria aponina SAG 52.96 = DSM 107014]|uniref:DUF3011 domain-containing protein n=1 Tax=Gomphosphaeria aponina SAG 52.96 = DSM 107014 TaxID=1521640 RepID=A0A941JRP8_9CHRO|nr:DUF3011 domain-containing protein [Gomphosphaeria aponina SAG 52.96 = DSM 107014]
MITKISRLTLIAGITLGLIVKTTPALANRNITCESQDGRYKFCRIDTRGGVRLERQLSSTRCSQGNTWGYDRDGIWVDDGCRAEFLVRDRNGAHHSNNNDGDDTAAIVGGAALAVGIIVGALAANSDEKNNNNNNSSDQSLTCASNDDRYQHCAANIRSGDRVALKRQLSSAGCWQGDTWGYDRDGIWVDNGCRGVFEIRR